MKNIKNIFKFIFSFAKVPSTGTCIAALLITAIVVSFASCASLSEDEPVTPDTVSKVVASSASDKTNSEEKESITQSQEDKTSETVISSEPENKKDTSSTHKHSYTKKVVKPTCTKDGYTKYTCSCGKSYKDDKTNKLGHLYLDWKVTKKATTTKTGVKECDCDRCGKATITETIPKKKKVAGVSSKIEITTSFGKTKYILGNASVLDSRSWGKAPTITVYNGNCMHVVYYNQKGEKVEFNVEQPVVDDTINGYTILEDGTYVSQYFGSYS